MRFNTLAKLIMLAFSSFSIVTTFQNCAQSKKPELATEPASSAGSDVNMGSSKVSEIDLTNASILEVQLVSLFSTSLKRETAHLQVNLSNGEMRYVNSEGQYISPVRLCLYKEELAEIKSIVGSSKVCIPNTRVNADTVCTMEYIYPYAKILLETNEIIKLGEKAGCSGIIDLCEESKKALNGYISYLASHLDNRKCL